MEFFTLYYLDNGKRRYTYPNLKLWRKVPRLKNMQFWKSAGVKRLQKIFFKIAKKPKLFETINREKIFKNGLLGRNSMFFETVNYFAKREQKVLLSLVS